MLETSSTPPASASLACSVFSSISSLFWLTPNISLCVYNSTTLSSSRVRLPEDILLLEVSLASAVVFDGVHCISCFMDHQLSSFSYFPRGCFGVREGDRLQGRAVSQWIPTRVCLIPPTALSSDRAAQKMDGRVLAGLAGF